jgi:1-deoxy-D-xylulose-5-phosphate synthase
VAIYSTFLQRGFDQIIHDVAIQELPVVFAIDRAGLVGADGPTHQGMFDMAYLRLIPNLSVFSPSNEAELAGMLKTALTHPAPIAVRYPRIEITGDYPNWIETAPIPLGVSHTLREGRDVALLAIGSMVAPALEASDRLAQSGVETWVIDMRSVKPIDRAILGALSARGVEIVTIEEHTLAGGFGSAVVEAWEEEGLPPTRIKRLGIRDHFVDHGTRETILQRLGLDSAGIAASVEEFVLAGRVYSAQSAEAETRRVVG